MVSLKHIINQLHSVQTTLEELDLAFGHCWYDSFMFNIDQPKLQDRPLSYRRFTSLKRLYLPPEVTSMDEPFSRVIPRSLRTLRFYGVNHELPCWLETLPAQLDAFPNLWNLELCIWLWLEDDESEYDADSDIEPPEIDYGQVMNDFVEKFEDVDISLIIPYDEDRDYDMEAIPHVEYVLDR
ncbi:hypothetical protein E8E11_000408 [Didymella keratinophila]|nr:hypothetical protein E8E11_000408 [Didymella keratinophila]